MASIKNLEMAAALSAHQNITIKKSLFSTKAVYEPTQSPMKPIVLEYTPTSGERLIHLLCLPLRLSVMIEWVFLMLLIRIVLVQSIHGN